MQEFDIWNAKSLLSKISSIMGGMPRKSKLESSSSHDVHCQLIDSTPFLYNPKHISSPESHVIGPKKLVPTFPILKRLLLYPCNFHVVQSQQVILQS